jgi:hypothetical protein
MSSPALDRLFRFKLGHQDTRYTPLPKIESDAGSVETHSNNGNPSDLRSKLWSWLPWLTTVLFATSTLLLAMVVDDPARCSQRSRFGTFDGGYKTDFGETGLHGCTCRQCLGTNCLVSAQSARSKQSRPSRSASQALRPLTRMEKLSSSTPIPCDMLGIQGCILRLMGIGIT